MGRKTSRFRHHGPAWFHAAELHQLAMVRTLVPEIMPALAALAVLPPDDLLAFVMTLKGEIVANAVAGTQISGASGHGHASTVEKILIRPAMTLAVCAHPEATVNDLLTRRKRFRDPMAIAGSAKYDWPCGPAMAFWQTSWCKDPYFLPLPPPMTPDEAELALSPIIALPWLLARPGMGVQERMVRAWAFEHLELVA